MKRILILSSLILCLGLLYRAVRADDPAINLSQSSGAFAPQLVADAEGDLHAVWRDTQFGFMYSRSQEGVWDAPLAANLPFIEEVRRVDTFELLDTTYFTPLLLADEFGNMHGFWLDDDRTLLHSQIGIDNVPRWRQIGSVTTIAHKVLDFDAAIGTNGTLLLAYVSTAQVADGLYTTTRLRNNIRWSAAVLQYESDYYRATLPEEVDVMLSHEVSNNHTVVVWDDPLLERLYYLDSADNGITWQELQTVDSRQSNDSLASPRPAELIVAQVGDEIHLVWQAGHASLNCTLFHQWSGDNGVSWGRSTIETGFTTCPDDKHLLMSAAGTPWLFIVWEDKMYQLVWDDDQWSTIQSFPELDQFIDPERVRAVQFRCRQPLIVADVLMTIGCDQQMVDRKPVFHDIWLTQHPLESLTFAFKASVWADPSIVVNEVAQVESLKLLPHATRGRIHAYWSEGGNLPSDQRIYYSSFDGSNWTNPATILQSPTGQTNQVSMALDGEGGIYAAWRGGTDGQIYTSRTDAVRAATASEWKSPVPLPAPNHGGSNPQIAVDTTTGRISLVFAIEVNEERGIYISHSFDQGESWTAPRVIANGASIGWDRVTKPQLLVSPSGRYHLMWHNETSPAGIGTLSLHYAYSDDGVEWKELSIMTDAPASWSRQLNRGEHIFQVWQVQDDLWYRESLDDGETWSRVESVSRLSAPLMAFDVTLDAAGELNVVQVTDSAEIQHLRRQNGRWQVLDRSEFDTAAFDPAGQMAIARLAETHLVAVQSGSGVDGEVVSDTPALLYTQRELIVKAAVSTPSSPVSTLQRPTPTPEPEAESEAMIVTTESLTAATTTFPVQPDPGVSLPFVGTLPNNLASILSIAIVPAFLLVAIAVVVLTRGRSD